MPAAVADDIGKAADQYGGQDDNEIEPNRKVEHNAAHLDGKQTHIHTLQQQCRYGGGYGAQSPFQGEAEGEIKLTPATAKAVAGVIFVMRFPPKARGGRQDKRQSRRG